MVGETTGKLIDSRNLTFKIGDAVVGFGGGWQQYALSDGRNLRKIDGEAVPPSAHLGAGKKLNQARRLLWPPPPTQLAVWMAGSQNSGAAVSAVSQAAQ
jgi:hypothetical protein